MRKIFGIAMLAAVVAGCSGGKGSKEQTGTKQQKLLVKTIKVETGYIARRLTYYGTVSGAGEAQIFPDMPGKLIEYKVKEGQRVKKDQVIALLDRSIPGMEYEPLVVKSPINGVVAFTYARPGQMCAPQMPIALVVDNSRLEVQADVPPEELPLIKVGQKAIVFTNGDSVIARVKAVSAAVDPMRKVGQVKVAVGKSKLWPGMMVKVEIILKEAPNAITVPSSAVVKSGDKHVVFVVENGIAHQREVTLGIEEHNRYEVKSDLKPGEVVVVEGAEGLSDGQPVEVAKW